MRIKYQIKSKKARASLSTRPCPLKHIFNRNDKSEHITHSDNVVRIIITWSECNYRISENTDISTVCWQSARGIYSKANRIDHGSSINARCKLAVEFYSRMGYTVFERS